MKTPRFWQTKNAISSALLPLSALYALGFTLDKRLTVKRRAPLPVISIGNITAGGAGKTPTAIAIAQLLRSMNETPHFMTRGYGGTTQQVKQVSVGDNAATVGDEALLLARHAPTWVARNRVDAALAAQQAGATIVVADDALQHHALAHDLSILVVDLATGFGNGRLLPTGPLRQTLASAYGDAPTICVAIGEDDPHQLLPLLRIQGEVVRARVQPVGDISWLRGKRWLAFAGIAYPQKFYATLRTLGADIVQTVDFPDHHDFTPRDIQQLQQRAARADLGLITTEKDAVRGLLAPDSGIHTLPIALQFDEPHAIQAALQSWRSGT